MDTGSAIAAVVGGERPSPIGILRISGDRLRAGGLNFLKPKDKLPTDSDARHRTVALCDFVLSDGSTLDTCLVSFFWAPQSFTGQDVVEIAMHGNPILLKDALLELGQHGIRPAGPGEFTMRAYLNGKMDLSQAEAIHDLVTAQNRYALEKSRQNLQGFIKREMSKLRSFLINLKADLEAELDFMDQDIEFIDRTQTIERTNELRSMIDGLLSGGQRGRQLSSGLWTVITGEPNVGKSTLLNALLGYDRAIVSDVPGTTRDYLVEDVLIGEHSLKIFDTAGIRAGEIDPVESQGIARSKELRAKANLHIEVVDVRTVQWPQEAEEFSSVEFNDVANPPGESRRIGLRIFNKADLVPEYSPGQSSGSVVQASEKIPRELNKLYSLPTDGDNMVYGFITSLAVATGGATIDTGQIIAQLIEQVLDRHFSTQEGILLSERAEFFLAEAKKELEQVVRLAEAGESPEYMCVHLDRVMESIGDITGRIDTEEVLGRIFSRFCIGK